MHTQVLAIDDSCDWQQIEHLAARFVDLLIVQREHLIPKVEHLCNFSGFMITPQTKDILGIVALKDQQQQKGLGAPCAPVYIVTKEQQLLTL